MARCPRWTPSKLPSVSTTRRSGGDTCARWRITRIAAARIAQARTPLKLLVELGQLLARQSRLGRGGVVLDELRHREARVGRVSHAEEELPLLPQRRRRLVALRVTLDDIVELRHCTLLIAPDRRAPRLPVERVVGERRALRGRRDRAQLRDGLRAVAVRQALERA